MKPTSEVTALVIDSGLFVETAVCLARTYKKVYYCTPGGIQSAFPKLNDTQIGIGLENIEVVRDVFGPHFDEIDLFVFPDVYFGHLQLHLLSLGKVVWGARLAEELELSREGCKALMKQLGLPVGPYAIVKGMAGLREHLKAHENQYVKVNAFRGTFETFHATNYKAVEPKLDEVEYNLGAFKHIIEFIVEDELPDKCEIGTDGYTVDGKYPSKQLAGIEIKDLGFIGIFKDYASFPEPLTRWNKVMAPVFKEYGMRGFFSTECRIGKDHVPYMIDACFDDQTEVLTDAGWKFFRNCSKMDMMATLNTGTGEIEYQRPTRHVCHDYKGVMIEITNPKKSIECMVTPDHDVLRMDRHKKKMFKEEAGKLTDKGFIPRTGLWNSGHNEKSFILPGHHREWESHCGRENKSHVHRVHHQPPKEIPMDNWVAFMAWYLAEGSTQKGTTLISQTKYPKVVANVIEAAGFEYSYDGRRFIITSFQLQNYLKPFGTAHQKRIPDYIKNGTRETIRLFLDNYAMADGSVGRGRKIYRTTCQAVADELQELIFKVGSVVNINVCRQKGTKFVIRKGGKEYTRNFDMFVLEERTNFLDFWFETQKRKSRYIKEHDYDGKVYCATVPNGTLYVRRNGKPFWSGNCLRQASPPGELYQEFYTNLADIIWQGANGALIDPKPIAKYGAEVLIHSSWADRNWQPIEFPAEYRRQIKLRNGTKINGRYYVIPQAVGLPEIGAVVGWGNTMEDAFNMCREIAETVEGYYITVPCEALDEAKEQVALTEKYGLKMF